VYKNLVEEQPELGETAGSVAPPPPDPEASDAAGWVERNLGFTPDVKTGAGTFYGDPSRNFELYAAVGEVDYFVG
jgi:hypothetical protein